MGSMSNNNWLGFSLSAAQLENSTSNFSCSDEISAAQPADDHESASCFDLTTNSSFNTNTHSQDWNHDHVKDVTMNMTSFSCSSSHNNNEEERPKLENFLDHNIYQRCNNNNNNNNNIAGIGIGNDDDNSLIISNNINYQISNIGAAADESMININGGLNNNSSTIGLSMIKNWLRNNPPPPPHAVADNCQAAAAATGAAQTLSLSMSSTTAIDSAPRKSVDTFGQRTSIYRGVTRHRWTGRYEAHLWDNSCRREGQTRKGKQVYLGGYDKEEKAARSYDLAALKYWGTTTTTNFPASNYEKEIEEMKHMTRLEFIASLRRKSSGFSRGASMYRGVTRHHQHGRWQARIGRVAGNKDLYLGTFTTQEEAAEAYDIAAIKFRGLNAVTNFEINRYDVKTILESANLPIGAAAKRIKDAENAELALKMQRASDEANLIENGWPGGIAFQQQSQPLIMYPYQRLWCKQEQDPETGFNSVDHYQIQHMGNIQNYVQPSVLHNLMSLDSCSMQNGPGSNPVMYGDGSGGSSFGIVQDEEKPLGYEGMFGLTDARNLYYQQQSQQQSSSCDYNRISTVVPTPGARNFTAWNDT